MLHKFPACVLYEDQALFYFWDDDRLRYRYSAQRLCQDERRRACLVPSSVWIFYNLLVL